MAGLVEAGHLAYDSPMPAIDRRMGLGRRSLQWMADSDPVRSLAIKSMHHIDRWVLDATGGKSSATGILLGLPIVTLTTTGAKTGAERRSILTGIPDAGSTILIASNFGQAKYPAWHHNLKANPKALLEVGGSNPVPHQATVLEGNEWDEAWSLITWHYSGYESYRVLTDRPIPVVRLVPSA